MERIDPDPRGDAPPRPPPGTINVIFAALGRTGSSPSRVMSMAQLLAKDSSVGLKRVKMDIQPILGFSDKDKVVTIQTHDDALVVTLKIEGYDVKRVLVDQGSTIEIMYPDLYKGLNLRSEDLTAYSYCGQALAPRLKSRFFHTSLEGEVPIPRPSQRDYGKPIYGEAVHGGCHITHTKHRVLGFF